MVRCAIYTRKSTEEGLEQEFNSLHAQREAGEAFVKSQAGLGWQCLAEQYDDGGFTGGNMDRPALRRLLAHIEAGQVDCVVVYKVDRLSRSLLDFVRMLEVFEKYQVSFVSVTQPINSTSSAGRLMLNVLLSFAQFEREIISERTRDKIAAARRKGKWSGGHPLLGYDVDPHTFRLVINEDEALRVRAIFALYLEHEALLKVVEEVERRGWVGKRWRTRKGRDRGGKRFTKTSVHKLLTNITYIGKVRYKQEIHAGEHASIVDETTWQRVQAVLQRNGRSGGALVRNRFAALLKGLLRCTACDCAMTPAHTTKRDKRYRYYTCTGAQKRGWHTCPAKSIPAGQIERLVVEKIKGIGQDPALWQETLGAAHQCGRTRREELAAERRGLDHDLSRWNAEVHTLVQEAAASGNSAAVLPRLADLQERVLEAQKRAAQLKEEISAAGDELVSEDDIRRALSEFDPLWASLTPQEQTRIVQLLVERVDYDAVRSKVSITFHPSGIRTLAEELAGQQKEKNA
jgi:site-specific DNA recombinase